MLWEPKHWVEDVEAPLRAMRFCSRFCINDLTVSYFGPFLVLNSFLLILLICALGFRSLEKRTYEGRGVAGAGRGAISERLGAESYSIRKSSNE